MKMMNRVLLIIALGISRYGIAQDSSFEELLNVSDAVVTKAVCTKGKPVVEIVNAPAQVNDGESFAVKVKIKAPCGLNAMAYSMDGKKIAERLLPKGDSWEGTLDFPAEKRAFGNHDILIAAKDVAGQMAGVKGIVRVIESSPPQPLKPAVYSLNVPKTVKVGEQMPLQISGINLPRSLWVDMTPDAKCRLNQEITSTSASGYCIPDGAGGVVMVVTVREKSGGEELSAKNVAVIKNERKQPAIHHPLPGRSMARIFADPHYPSVFGSEHTGVDWMAPIGSQVMAMCDGIVKGNYTGREVVNAFLIIEHVCPGPINIFGYYGHIQSSLAVGSQVKSGDVVGTVRSYGSNNHHLHFGIHRALLLEGWGRAKLGVNRSMLIANGWFDPVEFLSGKTQVIVVRTDPFEIHEADRVTRETFGLSILDVSGLIGRKFSGTPEQRLRASGLIQSQDYNGGKPVIRGDAVRMIYRLLQKHGDLNKLLAQKPKDNRFDRDADLNDDLTLRSQANELATLGLIGGYKGDDGYELESAKQLSQQEKNAIVRRLSAMLVAGSLPSLSIVRADVSAGSVKVGETVQFSVTTNVPVSKAEVVFDSLQSGPRLVMPGSGTAWNYRHVMQQAGNRQFWFVITGSDGKHVVSDPRTLNVTIDTQQSGSIAPPLARMKINQGFGGYLGTYPEPHGTKYNGTHTGVDLAGVAGTPVMSMADGVVSRVGNVYPSSYQQGGSYVVITHPQLHGGLRSVYVHVEAYVKVGQAVKAGQNIAALMKPSLFGSHLHLEVIKAGKSVKTSGGIEVIFVNKNTIPLGNRGYLKDKSKLNDIWMNPMALIHGGTSAKGLDDAEEDFGVKNAMGDGENPHVTYNQIRESDPPVSEQVMRSRVLSELAKVAVAKKLAYASTEQEMQKLGLFQGSVLSRPNESASRMEMALMMLRLVERATTKPKIESSVQRFVIDEFEDTPEAKEQEYLDALNKLAQWGLAYGQLDDNGIWRYYPTRRLSAHELGLFIKRLDEKIPLQSPPPRDCPLDYAPVCGVDGKTYGNSCEANVAGIRILSDRTCPVKDDVNPTGGEVTVSVSSPNVSVGGKVEVNMHGSLPSGKSDIYLYMKKATGEIHFWYDRRFNEMPKPWRSGVIGPNLPESNPIFGFETKQAGNYATGVLVMPTGSSPDFSTAKEVGISVR